jgi:hypothetical protein
VTFSKHLCFVVPLLLIGFSARAEDPAQLQKQLDKNARTNRLISNVQKGIHDNNNTIMNNIKGAPTKGGSTGPKLGGSTGPTCPDEACRNSKIAEWQLRV